MIDAAQEPGVVAAAAADAAKAADADAAHGPLLRLGPAAAW